MAPLAEAPLVHWRSSNRTTRGTYDIISLCASMLIICCWNAVHVDIPRTRTFRSKYGERIVWFLFGIFMPEILLTYAVGQCLLAFRISIVASQETCFKPPSERIKRFYSWFGNPHDSDPDVGSPVQRMPYFKPPSSPHTASSPALATDEQEKKDDSSWGPWTMTHSFYALMGGFSDVDPDDIISHAKFNAITRISRENRLPCDKINDRSKSGPLMKTILCAQIVFFWANCAARINQNLPLSLLEITTIAHSLCALCAYIAWWHKPQDVGGEAPNRDRVKSLWAFIRFIYDPFNNLTVEWSYSVIILSSAVVAALYGAPHLLGLHVHFATSTEHILWLISTGIVMVCPIVWVILLYLSIKAWRSGLTILSNGIRYVAIGFIIVYIPASVFLVCESVRQLFALPEAAFIQPQWTQYIPHFS